MNSTILAYLCALIATSSFASSTSKDHSDTLNYSSSINSDNESSGTLSDNTYERLILGQIYNEPATVPQEDSILLFTNEKKLYLIGSSGAKLVTDFPIGDARGVSADGATVYYNSPFQCFSFLKYRMECNNPSYYSRFDLSGYNCGFLVDQTDDGKCFYVDTNNKIIHRSLTSPSYHSELWQLKSVPDLLYQSLSSSKLFYRLDNEIFKLNVCASGNFIDGNFSTRYPFYGQSESLNIVVGANEQVFFNPINDQAFIFDFTEHDKIKIRNDQLSTEITLSHSFESIEHTSFSKDGQRLYFIGAKTVDSSGTAKAYILVTIDSEKLFSLQNDFLISSSKILFNGKN